MGLRAIAGSSLNGISSTSTALSPSTNDGRALGTSSKAWSDLYLASGAVINFNNGNMAITHSAGNLGVTGGKLNTTISTATVSATASIEDAAVNGIDLTTWTPATDPNTTSVFVTTRMRKMVVDIGTAGITGAGLSHPVAGYDYLVMQGNTNALDYAYVHESKFKKTGTGTLHNLSFYKPAHDGMTAGSFSNITLFDGDLDLTGVTFTNSYLMKTNRTNLPINTASLIYTSAGDQQVIPRERCGVVTSRYYPIEGVTGLFANTVLTRNIAWAATFVCSERTTWTKIGTTVGTAIASSVLRFGIYKDNAGVPGALILDAGTVSSATTGAKEVTISQSLDPGIYWLAVAMQGGASDGNITFASVNAWNTQGMGSATAQDGTYFVAASGALPNPFGSGTFGGGGFAPFMWMRK